MKREITPTSPQYKKKPIKNKKERTKYKIGIIELLLILLISFIGGLFSSLIMNNYLSLDTDAIKEVVYLKETNKDQEEFILNDSLTKIKPSVVNLFRVADNYLPADSLGSGLILTSDGWIVALIDQIPLLENYNDLVIITDNQQEYLVENIILDDYSGAAFIKATATDLAPAQFTNTENIAIGDEVLAVFNSTLVGPRVVSSFLENLRFYDQKRFSTTKHAYDILIANPLRKEYKGAPLINKQGEVIGLNLLDNRVLKHDYFTDVMPQVISKQKIQRIELDLEYEKAADNNGIIVKNIITPETGLIVGDIITKIDDQEIDKFNDFSHILYEYKLGDLANFSLIRKSKEIEVEVKL